MYSGNISVDFAQLEELCQKIKNKADEIDIVRERLITELHRLSGTGLEDIEYQLRNSIAKAGNLIDDLLHNADILEKSIELYTATEEEQIDMIRRLSDNLLRLRNDSSGINTSGGIIPHINNQSFFSSHYVINDDWLDDIVSEWRDK